MPRLGSGGSSKGPTLLLKRARTPLPSSSLAQALSFPALPSGGGAGGAGAGAWPGGALLPPSGCWFTYRLLTHLFYFLKTILIFIKIQLTCNILASGAQRTDVISVL